MNKYLLSVGALASALSLSASTLTPTSQDALISAPQRVSLMQVSNRDNVDAVRRLAPGVSVSTEHGRKALRTLDMSLMDSGKLDIAVRMGLSRASLPEGYVLYESFEDWDGADVNWTPDGWSVEMRGVTDKSESWNPSHAGQFDPAAADGEAYFKISWGTGLQDEWLISPYVVVGEGMVLSYWLYLEPMWLFMVDSEHIDWNTNTFIGDPEVAATLQIWAQAEGEEWVMLRDYADDYKDYTFRELAHMTPAGLEKNDISLDAFYGKNTRVAFRLIGEDGNVMYVDAVAIGYPSIDNVAYMGPTDMQYWGLTRSCDMIAIDTPIAMYPVFEPITWTNEDVTPNVTYTWIYDDPETFESVEGNDPYELTVEYHPNYTSEATMRNNFYSAPVLRAEANNCAPTQYQAPYSFIQAGGRPELVGSDGSTFDATVMAYNLQQLGLGMMTVDDERIGDMSIPVFGYNVNADQYWLNYSLNDETEIEGDYSHLIGIANLIWPTNDAPMVVKGVNVYGYGQIEADAELKATIYGINSDLSTDYESLTVIATKTIKGSDIIRQDPLYKCYMCLPFDFDEPAVVQATDEFPAYFVMFEGFNSEKVSYFAPLQSVELDPNYMCKGYILNHIDLSNHVSRPAYYSIKTMRYIENGEYIQCYGAFAIGLDAEYPWLTTDCESISLTDDGNAVEVALGSYYDGSALTVEAPEGITATVAGRYNNCVLTVSMNADVTEVEGEVIVKGAGVEVSIPVVGTSGISTVSNDNVAVESIYDLAGRRIESAATPGVYVVKYVDGSTGKLVVK